MQQAHYFYAQHRITDELIRPKDPAETYPREEKRTETNVKLKTTKKNNNADKSSVLTQSTRAQAIYANNNKKKRTNLGPPNARY